MVYRNTRLLLSEIYIAKLLKSSIIKIQFQNTLWRIISQNRFGAGFGFDFQREWYLKEIMFCFWIMIFSYSIHCFLHYPMKLPDDSSIADCYQNYPVTQVLLIFISRNLRKERLRDCADSFAYGS